VINAVDQLAELLGPLPSPHDPVDREIVERELGTRLPADYIEWSRRHPSLEFGRDFFKALAWSAGDLMVNGPKQSALWREAERDRAFHPDPGGLLQWGMDEEGGAFFWQMEGDPDDWPVVYCERFELVRFDNGFTDFLHGMLTGTITHPTLPPDCIGPGVEVDWL
jgi:hypothetical protein